MILKLKPKVYTQKKFASSEKNLKLKTESGFTLIESLIYASIVTVILSFAVLSIYQIIDSMDRVRKQRELIENQKFLIQKLNWVLENNAIINSPAVGASGPILSVNKLNFTDNPLVISLSDGVITLKTGAAEPVNLTNNYVMATGLIFDHLNFSGESAIRFRVALTNSISTTSIDTTIFVK